MDIYRKVLLALGQDGTPKSKQNKFIKLSIEAQDQQLGFLLKEVATMYSYHIKPSWSRTLNEDQKGRIPYCHREWASMQRQLNSNLEQYVNHIISTQKPEWQVQAERHGWRPPGF